MLTYFPTPYPDELWYSVLCRYHIRSGMFRMAWANPFFPNNSINDTIKMLPVGILSMEDIILNHTLFLYYHRMYLQEQKIRILKDLCSNKEDGLNRKSNHAAIILYYCPVCRKEEEETYGEAYWHREHQLPLSFICRKHYCKLKAYGKKPGEKIKGIPILPWMLEQEETEYSIKPYEGLLARASWEYLSMSLKVGPTPEYNNLTYALKRERYQITGDEKGRYKDNKELLYNLQNFYEEKIVKHYFGEVIYKETLSKIYKWEIKNPEPYILLSTMIGQTPEIMFGECLASIHEEQRKKEVEVIVSVIKQMIGRAYLN